VGITLIILTLLVRFILLPLSHKSVASQAKMKEIAPEIQKVKEQHKNDKQEQARKTMELYQKHGINPFSGCVSVLIQIPIVIGLFFVFFKGLPTIDSGALYSFIAIPEYINTHFLGIIDLAGKSAVLAVLAGGTQYFQMKLSMPPAPPLKNTEKKMSFKEELGRSMNIQMRYILPFIVF
ncbi:membrane protein insertase YidC, partial [candidate division KSB1 bacterium]|nr:membrane protein insertase YidC [candidate division KSB1 bacterium]NIT69857.1 membrane protein insertase YidC [candidate division KSB1 bacterium]NIU90480.1 membrane protein insertase YidC [candidate division KSB1 bacterium]NIW68519.1 membrane protein insertase YidC [candidate division KSB1 bacterium]NIX69538.1 membrane protein insertase YidC [candidate division KSB1 bacterium]